MLLVDRPGDTSLQRKRGGGAPCRSGAWLKNNFLAAIGGESSYRLRCRSTPQDGPPYEARSHGAEFAIRGAISPLALCSGMKTKVLVCDGVDCIVCLFRQSLVVNEYLS